MAILSLKSWYFIEIDGEKLRRENEIWNWCQLQHKGQWKLGEFLIRMVCMVMAPFSLRKRQKKKVKMSVTLLSVLAQWNSGVWECRKVLSTQLRHMSKEIQLKRDVNRKPSLWTTWSVRWNVFLSEKENTSLSLLNVKRSHLMK